MSSLTCTFCGSPEYFAVKPGQANDATPLTPNQRQAVLLFPSREPEIPTVVWCWDCHPMSRRTPEPVSADEAEFASW